MRTDVDRRSVLKGVGVAGVAGLAGCTGGPTGGDGGDGGGNASTNGTDGNASGSGSGSGGGGGGADANVAMVYALGGLGDRSFNDAAQRGVQRAKEQLGVSYRQFEPQDQDAFARYQRRAASSGKYELVECIGYAQASALRDTASNFPDQKFVSVDSSVDRENVASYRFKEHQGSFQAGHLAGLLTGREFDAGAGSTEPRTTQVGFVGGESVSLIRKFEAGYAAGANHASEDVQVESSYIGSFNDASSAKATARSMYSDGVDIIYHAAGAAGVGVFQAAVETGNYVIGVDSAQSKTQPEYANVILGSMVKGVDRAVYESIKNLLNDNFKGGSTVNLGLKTDGVTLAYGQQLGDQIPEAVKSDIDESREKIINGEIDVPKKP